MLVKTFNNYIRKLNYVRFTSKFKPKDISIYCKLQKMFLPIVPLYRNKLFLGGRKFAQLVNFSNNKRITCSPSSRKNSHSTSPSPRRKTMQSRRSALSPTIWRWSRPAETDRSGSASRNVCLFTCRTLDGLQLFEQFLGLKLFEVNHLKGMKVNLFWSELENQRVISRTAFTVKLELDQRM